jgi:hypothetical protein
MAISLPIVSKFDDKGVNQAESGLEKLKGFAKGAGIAIAASFAAATAAVTALGIESVKAASDFEETSAAVGEIFGGAAGSLEKFSETAAKALGQTRTQFLNGAKTFGIFGKAAGLAEADNAEFSKTLGILATDLASFNNTDVDTAINAIGAALRGESEPIRQFGVLLDDATLKARAMSMGIYDGTGSLTQQQRVMAAYQEVLAQTTTQQGDFARTSDGLANSSRIVQAQFEDLKITIGEALLPVVEEGVTQLQGFIDNMIASPEFNDFLEEMTVYFTQLAEDLPGVVLNIGNFVNDIMPVINAIGPLAASVVNLLASGFKEIDGSDPATPTNNFAEAMRNVAGAMNAITSAINGITGAYNRLPAPLRAFISPLLSGVNFTALKMPSGSTLGDSLNRFFKVPQLQNLFNKGITGFFPGQAEGGTTIRPGLSWVGENGPELMSMPRGASIIPLDRVGSGNGGTNVNIVVNAGMGTDGAAVGEQIVNAIRRYERTSGAVFARA